jgi:signal transduction histidine kinase
LWHKIYNARLIQQLKDKRRSEATLAAAALAIRYVLSTHPGHYRPEIHARKQHAPPWANDSQPAGSPAVRPFTSVTMFARRGDRNAVRRALRTPNATGGMMSPSEWRSALIPPGDGSQIVQAILLEQDVTEKRRLEATLAQSEKLAAVGQLAAGLAHEINNPLTAIIANAQLLQRELPGDDDKLELVDLITRAGARATQVVRNLLDLARKEHYDFAPVDLNETLNRALKLLQHELVARSVNLDFEPSGDLPAVMASQDHLQGVWINLLSNAVDALENGTRDLHISTRQQGNEVRVIISDTGKGIPPERLPRIFEPFYTTKAPGRAPPVSRSVTG